MKIQFDIDKGEKFSVVIERNWFTGKFTCVVNGQIHLIKNPLNPGTHVQLKRKKTYTVAVGNNPTHQILIEHTMPRFFAGFRPHEYRVLVDEKEVSNYRGY